MVKCDHCQHTISICGYTCDVNDEKQYEKQQKILKLMQLIEMVSENKSDVKANG